MSLPLLRRSFRLVALLTLLLVGVSAARPTLAASFTVSNTNDSGAGSLRDAITQANASAGPHTITFSVTGQINVSTPLPSLTRDSITIDGLQGGVPKIEIRGSGGSGQGIAVESSSNTIRGLIINGFDDILPAGAGIVINGLNRAANGNIIEKCYLGTDATGNAIGATSGSNNTRGGILVTNGASNNTIRDNIIAGNSGSFGYGIYLYTNFFSGGAAVSQNANVITNNRIGLNVAGSALLNSKSGIYIGDNSNNTIVGPDNVISGNGIGSTDYGITISGQNNAGGLIKSNSVRGNKIGTDATGVAQTPNLAGGIFVGVSDSTIIGGPDGNPSSSNPNRGNLIAGNNTVGVLAQGNTTVNPDIVGLAIQNNWIGTNQSGAAAFSAPVNQNIGVRIERRASNVTVGPGNVISGNTNYGVLIIENPLSSSTPDKQAHDNVITGNLIGTNAAGTAALANGILGVFLRGKIWNTTVSNNRISGNTSAGIQTGLSNLTPSTGQPPYNNTISGNQIGTLVSGAAIGNGATGNGINLTNGTPGNIIGPNNTVSGHKGTGAIGISLDTGATTNQITSNTISGNTVGVRVTGSATDNLIQKNTVQNNTNNGIEISGSGVIKNKITQTTTSGNGGAPGKGILLSSGGNNGLVPPTVGSLGATATTLTGNITAGASACGGGCTVEVFDAGAKEDFEGPFYLASFNVTGNGAFTVNTTRACQNNVTFTITDAAGNTSEFSAAQSVPACTGPAPALGAQPQLTPATATQTAAPGSAVTFSAKLSNVGTAAGTFNIVVGGLPASWNAVVAPTTATLAPGDAAIDVTVTATVPAGTDGGSYVATLTVTTQENGTTATAQDTVQVPLTPALTFTPPTQAKSAGAGQNLCYDHTLTNTANGADTFTIAVGAPAGWTPTVQPGTTIALAKGEAKTVTVCLAIPLNAAPTAYPTTITAQSNTAPQPSASATDTTTIIATAVPKFDAATTQPGTAGATVTVAHTLSNIGNAASDFDLALVTLPPGFTLVTPPPATSGVIAAPSGSVSVSYAVQLPPNVLAGSYNVTLKATARDSVAASATVIDVITVAQVAALKLTPDITALAVPYTVVTYTQTLKNDGNFTDNVTLTATASRGWVVKPVPPTLSIAPGTSQPVSIVLTVPLGQRAGIVNTTYVTATSSLPGFSASARVTTTIDSVPGLLLTPPSQRRGAEAGKSFTFTYYLTNTGSVDQSYSLASSFTASIQQADWQVSVTPSSPTNVLAPGESVPVKITVTSPAGVPDGSFADVTLTATSSVAPNPAATVTARLRTGPPFNVIIDPDRASSNLPGTLVRYTQTITNAGFNDDTIVLSSISDLGWDTIVTPRSVLLPPDGTAVITVTVVVPSSASAGDLHTTTVTARSTGDPTRFDTALARTSVLQVGGVDISPSRFAALAPSQTIIFQHIVTNQGNGADSYTITMTQDLNWSVVVSPTQTVRLTRGLKYPVEVRVLIPADAPKTGVNRIAIRATSRFDPKVFSELVDTISPVQTQAVIPTPDPTPPPSVQLYLPIVGR